MEGIPDSGYGRVNQSRPIPNSQDPTRAQDPDPRSKSNIHTVHAAIKLPQMKQNPQSENPDYENVSSACVPKFSLTNMDGESDTSEEDEVNYSTVSAVKEPRHNQRSRLISSSSDDEDRTEYSAIKT